MRLVRLERRVLAAGGLLAMLALAGCSFGRQATVMDLTWASNDSIFALRDEYDRPNRLVRFSPEHPEDVEVPLAPDSCPNADPVSISRLTDHSIAIAVNCSGLPGTVLFEYDFIEGLTTRAAVIEFEPRDMTWSSAVDGYAIWVSDHGRCMSMIRIEAGRALPFTVPITIAGTSWLPDAGYRAGVGGCDEYGDVSAPVVSPASDVVSFAASGDAAGVRSYRSRQLADASIVAVPIPEGQVRVIATGFRDVRAVEPSPDGKVLFVSGSRGEQWSCWAVETATGSIRDLGVEQARAASSAPDGRRLVVATTTDEGWRVVSAN